MKKYKRKKTNTPAPVKEKKPFNFKLLLILLLATVVIFGIYRIFIALEIAAIMWIYMGLTCALFIAYFYINRGMSNKPTPIDDLPEEWSAVQKTEFLAEEAARKKKAKYIFILLLPFLFTFFFDIVELFYVDYFKHLTNL